MSAEKVRQIAEAVDQLIDRIPSTPTNEALGFLAVAVRELALELAHDLVPALPVERAAGTEK